ncbi:hypothetical protein Anapl_07449 [Anas platyrhynchos]|uniref:Uncharacterized protein n=1 Tax=Anas platyrhynchos TaxID=8839 RepID=R0L6Z4_ANAPL|nr:hypothetical protein Anapl_07449 [Anas platyrhynchos]
MARSCRVDVSRAHALMCPGSCSIVRYTVIHIVHGLIIDLSIGHRISEARPEESISTLYERVKRCKRRTGIPITNVTVITLDDSWLERQRHFHRKEVCNLPVSLLREQNSECANMTHATVTSCPVSVLKADVIEPNKALSWLGVTFVQQQAQQKTNSLVLGVTHLWRWWECDNLSTNEITERVML